MTKANEVTLASNGVVRRHSPANKAKPALHGVQSMFRFDSKRFNRLTTRRLRKSRREPHRVSVSTNLVDLTGPLANSLAAWSVT